MISIVMPAHNEEGYVGPAVAGVIDGLQGMGLEFEIIVSENGSADGTAAEAEALIRTHPEVQVLRAPTPDYGKALRTGFLTARGDIVVDLDVDFVDLDFVARALHEMADGTVAIVIGSKRMAGAHDQRGFGRKVVTGAFSNLLRYGFGLQVSDTHGVKAMRRAPIEPLVKVCLFGKEIFDTELVLRAERAGLRVVEIPVTVTDQRPARTSILRRIPRTLVGLARLRVALWREGR
jgi:glycosyltransferase involved in cell wall biosynthesis